MPTYSYKCEECKNVFDELHQMKDSDKKQSCPECGGMASRYYAHTTSHFVFTDAPGASIIDKSPMKNANKGLPDNL